MRTTFLLTAIVLLVTSCSGQLKQPVEDESPINKAEQIQQLLQQAKQSQPSQRTSLRLQAAQLLLDEGQRDLVDSLLGKIQPEILELEQLGQYLEISSKLAIQRGDYEGALALLESPQLMERMDLLETQQQLRLQLLRAEVLALLGSHIASAQQRIYINPLLDADNQRTNRKAIWASLMYVSKTDIKHYLENSFRGEYQGWLQLALIAKENQADLDSQVAQLNQWQQSWPDHPAHSNLPGGLELIRELAANRPQRVALLLPLTGKLAPFGKAVRDGFIAASYQTLSSGGQVPRIKIYNTEDTQNFVALYYQAVAEGAELIIGPLEKYRVSLLYDEIALPVPTLALNRLDDYGPAPALMYQFGLAPQDEAQQIAEIARLENKQQALILSPQGSWGDKVSATFSSRWEELGGYVTSWSRYSGQQDYSKSVKDALLLQESEDRAKRISRLVGEHIEFSPRRRQDIDMIFMLASPQQARSLNPLLAYHYAGDIPVYGTSRLYNGHEEQQNRDLNGIRFTDMPWVLNQPSELQQQINSEIEQSKPYQRMYALGVDSFQLYPRLRQLEEMANSRVYGQTGTLRLNAQREIERQMLYAKIQNGKSKLIPTASMNINLSLPELSQSSTTTREGMQNAQKMAQQNPN